MAIGADYGLPKQNPSPLRAPPPGVSAQKSAPSYGYMPPMVNDNAVQSMVNNQLANGGAGEMSLRSMDRAGMSRGRGQQYIADVAAAQSAAEGRSAAAQTEASAAGANANARMAYANTMRNEQLSNAGLLENLRSSSAMERLSREGWRQNMYEAMRRGQFQLDSLQPDYGPLYQSFADSLFS